MNKCTNEIFPCLLSQVTHSFCKEFLRVLLSNIGPDGDIPVADVMKRLFFHATPCNIQTNECESGSSSSPAHLLQPGSKAKLMSDAYHRYALNYINALNYLESLRRHQDFCDFEKVLCSSF